MVGAVDFELEVYLEVLVGLVLDLAHQLQHLGVQLFVEIETGWFFGGVKERH